MVEGRLLCVCVVWLYCVSQRLFITTFYSLIQEQAINKLMSDLWVFVKASVLTIKKHVCVGECVCTQHESTHTVCAIITKAGWTNQNTAHCTLLRTTSNGLFIKKLLFCCSANKSVCLPVSVCVLFIFSCASPLFVCSSTYTLKASGSSMKNGLQYSTKLYFLYVWAAWRSPTW